MFKKAKNISLNKIICWLLPLEVDRPRLLQLTEALLYGLVYTYQSLLRPYADEVETLLSTTGQVWSLEKVLNDRFDEQRRIYIEDGEIVPDEYLYREVDDLPLYLYTEAEGIPRGLPLETLTASLEVAFLVRYPQELQSKTDEIRAIVAAQKIAGMTFALIPF